MNIIYSKKHFNLYKVGRNSFIIHNINKEFKYGHTHINNYNTAKFLINLALYKTVPDKNMSKYLYQSLIRISSDQTYINKIRKRMNRVR